MTRIGRPVPRHASGDRRDPWLCCGCGNELLPDGTTGCDCATQALFRMRDDDSLTKGCAQMKIPTEDVGTDELLELRAAVVALADAADKCSEAPHYIVQPFLGIYRKHGETIARARASREQR